MLKLKFLPFALLVLSNAAFAQQAPSAGSQLQQIPPAPIPERAVPELDVQRGSAPVTPASDTAKITVNRLNISGAQVYPEAELLALTGFRPGSELTLTDLRGMAARISDHYHRNGYFVAQTYLPPQDIKEGAVTIAVIEGRYGNVTLNNQTNLSDRLANNLLGGLNSGDPVVYEPLENRLLLLSDLPGVKVKSTLVPGAAVGTSDLLVDVLPGPRVSGSVDADNAGNRYTGEYRVGATVNLNNPTGNGDVASLRVMTSGPGLKYARASYQAHLGKATLGVAYSHLEYQLGREFKSLQANGTAKVASIYGSYPLIRSRNANLVARLGYDDRTFQDRVDSTGSVSDKKGRALTASLAGDHRDSIGAGGVSAYSLAWTTGHIDLRTPGVRAVDAATARSQGHYNKLGFSAMRLQGVTDVVSLYAGINGQFASKNLDVSEKMQLGGMYGVRAYPQGEAFGDQGYLLTLEARLLLPKFSPQMPGRMQLIAFADTGTVTTNKEPWAAGSNSRTLSGAGVGVNWAAANDFSVKAFYARKLGNAVATSAPDKSGRFWIQAVKYF